MIEIDLPLRTVNSLNNSHGHWRVISRRRKRERGTACMMVRSKIGGATLPATVTLTRLSAGELDDDGLRAALKSVRDGVADAFGTDDSAKSKLRFEYTQERCKRGAYGVRVQIEGEG